jgi:hypothetical protein
VFVGVSQRCRRATSHAGLDNETGRQLRRPYGSKLSAVSRKRWRTVPDLPATSSRHSGLPPGLLMMPRILSEHSAAASSKQRHHPANQRPRRLNESLGEIGICNAPWRNYRTPVCRWRLKPSELQVLLPHWHSNMRNVRPEDGSRMLVMNLGCSPHVKQRGEVGCRAAFLMLVQNAEKNLQAS